MRYVFGFYSAADAKASSALAGMKVATAGHSITAVEQGIKIKHSRNSSSIFGDSKPTSSVRCPAPGCGVTLSTIDLVYKRPEDTEFENEINFRRILRDMYV